MNRLYFNGYYDTNGKKAGEDIMAMSMTDEEAEALDEEFTYIMTRADAAHKEPSQIIGELVRERLAATAG